MTSHEEFPRREYLFVHEPRAPLYHRILDYAASVCPHFAVVVRDVERVSPTSSTLLAQLRPFIVEELLTTEWPGTVLLEGQAHLYKYRLTQQALEVLKSSSTHLFQWRAPELPEDLCLIRPNGEPWLGMVAHERDGWINLNQPEYSELVTRAWDIEAYIQPRSHTD